MNRKSYIKGALIKSFERVVDLYFNHQPLFWGRRCMCREYYGEYRVGILQKAISKGLLYEAQELWIWKGKVKGGINGRR